MVLITFPSSLPSTELQCLIRSERGEPVNGLAMGRKEHSLGKARSSSLYAMQTEVTDNLGNKDMAYLSMDLKAS